MTMVDGPTDVTHHSAFDAMRSHFTAPGIDLVRLERSMHVGGEPEWLYELVVQTGRREREEVSTFGSNQTHYIRGRMEVATIVVTATASELRLYGPAEEVITSAIQHMRPNLIGGETVHVRYGELVHRFVPGHLIGGESFRPWQARGSNVPPRKFERDDHPLLHGPTMDELESSYRV
jgi:hypothetical protein